MTTKTALVTGARSGVGYELTRKLLRDDWQVIALVRSQISGDDVMLAAEKTGQLRYYMADMTNLAELRRAIQNIKDYEDKIDILFNNAGVSTGQRENSPQGRELHFELNVLVPYILSQALLPLIEKSSMRRIVNTSSNALLSVKTFDVVSLPDPPGFQKLLGPYARSKLALSLWTKAAAPSFAKHGVTLVSVCPGPNRTPMTGGEGMPLFLKLLVPLFFKHPSVGADKLLQAALAEDLPNGSFVMNNAVRALPFEQKAGEVLAMVNDLHKRLAEEAGA